MTETSFSLAFGTGQETFDCQVPIEMFSIQEPAKVITAQVFAGRLTSFLAAAAPDLSRPAVVVADKTRLCGYPEYLPVLLKALTDHGADPQQIRVYIASTRRAEVTTTDRPRAIRRSSPI